ncbi:LacI family DNA-binding transcriptional regulator [Microbacterium sp. CIAB417]|uniref:LacI family DNA-binding transcriptional regulator n=1 Tax=Microbacterium sp. CIAB417 TaxID=2860287 RepID=UPI0027E31FDC|nr:LacI family DNA-binding transcriptional regulator [Microbacterium sp. CIAB417]
MKDSRTEQIVRRPTMSDVAALARVSSKTVSRVINDEPRVSPVVQQRVREAIERLSYRPDPRAGSLRRSGQRSETIGLAINNVDNPFSAAVHRAIEDAAVARGVAVLASSTDDVPVREPRVVEGLLRRRVDGLIAAPVSRDQSYLRTEQKYGTPMVFIDREPVGVDADAVVSDHTGGARMAASHLIEVGHRRIAFLGDLTTLQSTQQRLTGFREALGYAGIPTTAARVVTELHSADVIENAVRALMNGHDRPTALFSAQNSITIGTIRALRALDMHNDVALIGFDDILLADLLVPAITVIAQDSQRIGSLAAERLFARLDGDRSATATHVVPVRLVTRGSGEIPPA